ncbi:MAG TPA: DUF1800 domain-containing protein [Pyrinomonadaceae bacterium]|jgi:uncharacterized protein (DUF1800 family)
MKNLTRFKIASGAFVFFGALFIAAALVKAQPSVIKVLVSPTSATVNTGGTQQFTVKVGGSGTRVVVWSVNGVAGGNSQVGMITGGGKYTAPAALPANPIVQVRATSAIDSTAFSNAVVTLQSQPPASAGIGRFLKQTTFGATPQLMTHVQQTGFNAFLDEQFALPESTYPNPLTATRAQMIDRFWINAFKGNDQLRQRVVYALSQIWVVSLSKNNEPEQVIPWLQILSRNAFGNYRNLMREATLDASMGHYLDLVNSNKPNGTSGANENYARELMQLFTIGLYKLNQDGSLQLDGNNQPIPAYTQTDVRQLALALTGWTYPTTPGQTPSTGNNGSYYIGQMEPRQINHDATAKTILGQNLPANQMIQDDLDDALDIIFQHPNVAPFVSTRLIRALVTSNPSPAYIARISAVFNDNGQGVRGDLKAVIRAILLDPEARDDSPAPEFGRLRSPLQHTVAFLRALNVNINEPLSFAYLYTGMGESIINAPTVFGHYSPLYKMPGNNQLFAPEFQIYTPTESVNRANFIYWMMNEGPVDLTPFTGIASDSTQLINAVNARLLDGKMTPEMRASITKALLSSTDNRSRALTVLYLVATSGDFIIQR